MQCITYVINPADACLLTLGSLPPMPILCLHLAGFTVHGIEHTLLHIIIVLIISIRNNIIYRYIECKGKMLLIASSSASWISTIVPGDTGDFSHPAHNHMASVTILPIHKDSRYTASPSASAASSSSHCLRPSELIQMPGVIFAARVSINAGMISS